MPGRDFHAEHARNLHIPFADLATAGRRQKPPIKDEVETTLEKIQKPSIVNNESSSTTIHCCKFVKQQGEDLTLMMEVFYIQHQQKRGA